MVKIRKFLKITMDKLASSNTNSVCGFPHHKKSSKFQSKNFEEKF